MSATSTLRAKLSAANIDYGVLGGYTTYVTSSGLSWALTDNYDGTICMRVNRATPDEVMSVFAGHGTAHVLSVCDEDGVGHSKCGECGSPVGEWYRYCPWCGARFTEIERTYRP